MAEPGGDGSEDHPVVLPRIGPLDAGGGADAGTTAAEPEWVPAPPEAYAAIQEIVLRASPPVEPADPFADLAVGQVVVVGADGEPIAAPGTAHGGASTHAGGPPAWVLAAGVLVVLVAVAAGLVAVQRREDPPPRYAFPDGLLVREQTAPEAVPVRQWEMDVACGAYDSTALEGQFTATPGCELGADDEQVYLLRRTQGEDATLTAFDGGSGRQVWQAELDQDPDLVSAFAGLVFVTRYGFGRDQITAFDQDSGRRQWSSSGGGSPFGVGRTMVVSRSSDGVAQVAGVSLDDGDDRWVADLDLVGLCDGVVYGTGADEVAALEPVSGDERWRVELAEGVTVQCAGPQLITLDDGRVRSLDPADGSERWARDLGTAAPLSVLPGVTLVRSDGRLVALEPADGAVRWSVDGDRLADVYGYEGYDIETALGADDTWAYVVDLATGRLVGREPLGKDQQLAVPQGVIVTIDRGAVDAFGLGDLEPVWDLEVPTATRRIVLGGERLYTLGPTTVTAYA